MVIQESLLCVRSNLENGRLILNQADQPEYLMQGPSVLRVRFFREESGRELVREWLKALPTQERRKIGADIRSIQFRWPVGLPWARPMGEGMWEVRSNLKDRIARILFIIEGGEMILLHGIIKKTEKTPPSDLALARAKARKFREQAQRK